MTWKKLLLTLLAGVALGVAIMIFGPMLSKNLDKNFRKKIDKNGTEIKGIITRKREFKGREIYFKYEYSGRRIINYEDSHFYYELEVGDSVMLKVDTIQPKDSYILSKL